MKRRFSGVTTLLVTFLAGACADRPQVIGPAGEPGRDGGRDSGPLSRFDAATEGGTRDAASDVHARADAARDAGAPPLVSVLTQHDDIARTGQNLQEMALTVASVASARFGKIFSRAVDDQVYSQPLLVAGVDLPGRGPTNVLYVATVNDTVYAFDADDPSADAPIWKRSFLDGTAIPVRNTDMTGACNGHYTDFTGNIGVVGTPVIDPSTGTLYAVARTHEGTKFVQRLHAISIVDGTERPSSPVEIIASVPGTGEGGTLIAFDPLKENQRPALLLLNGIVYIGFAGHCDWGPYHGWILGYDATTLTREVVHNTTPGGNAGGVWQSGQGPSSDGQDLFVITGNGTVGEGGDPRVTTNRGESFMKLRRSGSSLKVESFFTPYNYADLELGDLDLGTAGLLLIPGTRLGVSGGKQGILYVVDIDDMGGLTSSTTTDDNVIQTFAIGPPYRIAGSPIFWKGPSKSFVYVWGDSTPLVALPFLGASYQPGSKVLDVDHMLSSSDSVLPSDPGAMLSLSANGSAHGTGVVWASRPLTGNANQATRPGIVSAYDAETLTELWNSQTNAARDDCGNFAKFSYPTVANGKVYVASFSNQVCVYGLSN